MYDFSVLAKNIHHINKVRKQFKAYIKTPKIKISSKNAVKLGIKMFDYENLIKKKLNHKNRMYLSTPYINQSKQSAISAIISSPSFISSSGK